MRLFRWLRGNGGRSSPIGRRELLRPPAPDFMWPAGWEPIRGDAEPDTLSWPRMLGAVFGGYEVAATLAEELGRECCQGHPLHGRRCEPVAFNRADPNEFLFVTDSPDLPVAFVHLKWAEERSPQFPYTVGYWGWEEFRVAWSREEP